MGVFQEDGIKHAIKGEAIVHLHPQDLAGGLFGKEVKAGHQQNDQADDHRRNGCQEIKLGADCHANGHGEKDEANIPRFLNRVAEANDRKSANQRKCAGNIRANNHHHEGNHHAIEHQGINKTLGIRGTFVSDFINPADEEA